ncbi:hypothetical protein ABBQ32_007064 [Trebouxia sp. C0010 RCD-2024]
MGPVAKHAGYPIYPEPSPAQQQLVQQTWAAICVCNVTSATPCRATTLELQSSTTSEIDLLKNSRVIHILDVTTLPCFHQLSGL